MAFWRSQVRLHFPLWLIMMVLMTAGPEPVWAQPGVTKTTYGVGYCRFGHMSTATAPATITINGNVLPDESLNGNPSGGVYIPRDLDSDTATDDIIFTNGLRPNAFTDEFLNRDFVGVYNFRRVYVDDGLEVDQNLFLGANYNYQVRLAFDDSSLMDKDTTADRLVLHGASNYTIDIEERCNFSDDAVRTDTLEADPDNSIDADTDSLASESRIDIFSFGISGDSVLNIIADVGGFDQNTGAVTWREDEAGFVFFEQDAAYEDGDITLNFGERTGNTLRGDITGELDLGTRGAGTTGVFANRDASVTNTDAVSDVVLTNSGRIRNIDTRGGTNIEFTNFGSVYGSSADDYGLDASDVDDGYTLTNKSGGFISNVDLSDTEEIVLLNESGAEIGGLLINSDSDASTSDQITTLTNSGLIGNTTINRIGQLNITNNSGATFRSSVDEALLLSGSAVINFNNGGTIEALSSDAINIRCYVGSFSLNNTGTLSASTNNVIVGTSDATNCAGYAPNTYRGSFAITNSGTISNNSNRGIELNEMHEATISFDNTSGTVQTNQTALSFSDAGGNDDMTVTVSNGSGGNIASDFSRALDASNVENLTLTNNGTMSSGSDLAVDVNGASAVSISNIGSSAAITAATSAAVFMSDVTGPLSLTNSGRISAFHRTINAEDAEGTVTITNSGTIETTMGAQDALQNNYAASYAVIATRGTGGTGGAAKFENTADGTISTNGGSAVVMTGFTAASTSSLEFTNAGEISSGFGATVNVSNNAITSFDNESGGSITASSGVAIDFSDSTDVTFTNASGATVRSYRDIAVLLDDVAGTSAIISNFGNILAGASAPGSNPAAIKGDLAASISWVQLTNGASGVISSVGDPSNAAVGGAIDLDVDEADVEINNNGVIRAGVEAASGVSGSEADFALRIEDVGNNAVTINNSGSGRIIATGNTAIFVSGGANDVDEFTLNNTDSATISADDFVVRAENFAGASATIINEGTISATSSTATHLLFFDDLDSFSFTNSGTISSEGASAVSVNMNGTSAASVVVNNLGGAITSNDRTFVINDISRPVDFDNAGTISATAGSSAVAFHGIGNNAVTFNNNLGGTISASDFRAVNLQGLQSAVTFVNAGTISARDETLVFDGSGSPTMRFTNSGRLSATSSAASHLVHLEGFADEMYFNNSGRIETSGASAVVIIHSGGTPWMNFTNSGTISSAGHTAVSLVDFTASAIISNSGTISTGNDGDNALFSHGGNYTLFTNTGNIRADGDRAVRFETATGSGGLRRFINGGTLSAYSSTFSIDNTFTDDIEFTNTGTIEARTGSHAVDLAGHTVDFNNSGTITSGASPAVAVGENSSITISGNVSAGGTLATINGTRAVAVLLDGASSTIRLEGGANVIGDITVAAGAPIPSPKHAVLLDGVTNASYFYQFNTDYFSFKIDGKDQVTGSGFSPATTLYTAMPVMHQDHAKMQRRNFRSLAGFASQNSLRSVGFTGDTKAKKTAGRNAKVSGDRSGFVQSVQQSIFDLFDAEAILATSSSSYEVDDTIFTVGQDYTGFGLAFKNLLNLGPFSVSAMAIGGMSESDVNRLVYSNTVDAGFFNLRSSYETTHVDAVYEAVFDFLVYGPEKRLTRRRPYRVAVELGFGGSLHSTTQDGFAEGSYISTAENTMESNSSGGRLKVELEVRNPFDRRHIFSFLEFESVEADITKGNSFSYTVDNETSANTAPALKTTNSVLSLGVVYDLDEDIALSFAHTATDGDTETESSRSNLSLKWRF